MSGRAGRKGLASAGESIMICRPNELNYVLKLIDGTSSIKGVPSPSTFIVSPGIPVPSTSKEDALQRLILV